MGETGLEPAYSNYWFNVRLEGGSDTHPDFYENLLKMFRDKTTYKSLFKILLKYLNVRDIAITQHYSKHVQHLQLIRFDGNVVSELDTSESLVETISSLSSYMLLL